ncbi:MAG: histidine triad nucleotide-binding protein [Ruminococcaceae bacterium]|nr:histidine triad nucleotide-binding protein [Oscillospiraceae bacterium]
MDCIFCKIADGSIPSGKVYEDDLILCFKDINPQAEVHALVIPKQHIASVNGITAENSDTVKHIFEKIPEIAKLLGVNDYRVISNCGEGAGQTVMHLHFHILSGSNLGERLV